MLNEVLNDPNPPWMTYALVKTLEDFLNGIVCFTQHHVRQKMLKQNTPRLCIRYIGPLAP